MKAAQVINLSLNTILLLTGIIICIFVSIRTSSLVKQYQENDLTQKTKLISHQLEQFLDTHIIVLQDIASEPLLTQAVMQPVENMGLLIDYFQDVQVLGKRYDTVLVDFSGSLIHANVRMEQKDFSLQEWFSSLSLKHQDFFLGTSPNATSPQWLLAVPIKYNGIFEGAILITVPISEYLRLTGIDTTSGFHKITFLTDDGNQSVFGNIGLGTRIERNIKLSSSRLEVRYLQNLSSLTRDRFIIVAQIGVVISIIIIISVIIAQYCSRRLLIKPIQELEMSAKVFGTTGEYINLTKRRTIDEFASLADIYNNMVNAVCKRERSLDCANKRINAIMYTAADGIVTTNADRIIETINQSGTILFGLPADQMIGQNIDLFMSPVLHLGNKENEILSDNIDIRVTEHIIHVPDSTDVSVEMSTTSMQIDGKTKFTMIIRNITKRKQDEEKLRKAYRMESLGRLSAGVFHEILNPVNIISCGIHSLLLDEGIDPKIKGVLKSFLEEIDRITKITQGMLRFARSDLPKAEHVLIDDILEEALSVIEPEARLANIRIIKAFDGRVPKCALDKYSLRQVFLNMINNAKDAMAGDGTLTMSTQFIENQKNSSSFIRIKIADTGCGIPETNIGKIFEPFFTSKEEGKGTGLGLSESYRIIEDHNGTIHVESKEGEGTTFIIDIPC